MFRKFLAKSIGLVRNARHLRSSATLRDGNNKPVGPTTTTTTTTSAALNKPPNTPDPEQVVGAKMHKCNDFDRWLLVWTKKYPSKDQVPNKVTLDMLHHAQSKGRIHVANVMILITIAGCIWAIVSGKRHAKAGNTMGQINLDWHAKINQEYRDSQTKPEGKTS